jgi:hypothetical protein
MIHHVTMFTLETADRVREVPEVLQWFGRHDPSRTASRSGRCTLAHEAS